MIDNYYVNLVGWIAYERDDKVSQKCDRIRAVDFHAEEAEFGKLTVVFNKCKMANGDIIKRLRIPATNIASIQELRYMV